jgi:hypothetical protein
VFVLTLAKPDGSADLGNLIRVELPDLPRKWIGHPDPKVDLAIIPCGEHPWRMCWLSAIQMAFGMLETTLRFSVAA